MLELFCTTEFAAESLEVDGPADSWLRASREMPPASSEVQTVSCSPGGLVLTRQEPSWNDCVTSRESKLHSVEVCTAAAAPASAPAAAAQPAAVSVFGEQECELTRHQNSQPASASPAAAASDGAAAVTCLTDGSDSSSKTAAPAVRSRQQKVGANLRTPGQQSSLPASQHQQQCPQLPPLQTATSSTCVDGLDVLLNSNCRRAHSSSINISSSAGASTSSSLSCDQPKDDGSAAWMTSLRSRSSPIGSCKRTMR